MEDLMKDLQEFLKNSQEKEDTVCLDVADPPCKRIRLEHGEEGADDLNHNGAIPSADDGNSATESPTVKVCNVCQKVNSADYQFTSFVFSVSLPPQLSVRESLFEVSVVFAHPETDEECHFLATACPDCFKPAKNKQSVFTRMAVIKALEKIKEEDFLKHFPCPPNSPKNLCDALEIQCNNGAVFVAGRPFAIELVNPRRIRFTAEEMRRLQQAINDSSDKIQVRDLQLVTREAIGRMKEGEEEKTKTYSALIWTDKAIQREDIAFLDDIKALSELLNPGVIPAKGYGDFKELKLDQKTPLRVLHRRPLAVRCRLIHTMKSEYIDEHHFRLHLKTQAGTYPWAALAPGRWHQHPPAGTGWDNGKFPARVVAMPAFTVPKGKEALSVNSSHFQQRKNTSTR
ncbi:hypothetical protein IHE44_0008772 [Lamprotornis superbus]|uniref:tRNA pseudouridine(55) synthase n=1 Tax=Lamprotornis superbus TaxID=245042 RepID=A0A835U0S8_9PASS|nr:hypothetical protein IHE44_0008772 [Lamprotornis superbus]